MWLILFGKKRKILNKQQQNGFENCDENDFVTNDFRGLDFSTKKKTKPLKLKKKFYEFYAAPMSKYICHFVSISIYQFKEFSRR